VEKNAYTELLSKLQEGEHVEAIVFGDWGHDGDYEPRPRPVPREKRGKILSLEEAKPFMDGWTLCNASTSPLYYATCIWTNRRVLWVEECDDSYYTVLCSILRHPVEHMPRRR